MAMDLARNWRLRGERYRLEGNVCTRCGAKYFPSRTLCEECRSSDLQPYLFKGEGELYSYTTLTVAPAGFESQAPYAVGMVKLDEGPMVEAQLTDIEPQDLQIGMRLEMVTRKLRAEGEDGVILYGYKFRQALNWKREG